jgi:hypothetical protein
MTKKNKVKLVYAAGALALLWCYRKDAYKVLSPGMGGVYMNKIPGKNRMLMAWG